MLVLDHVFCLVAPEDDWAGRCAAAGWKLDDGSVHAGQGTRNRRLRWAGFFLELLWVHDVDEARHNALRLDRRADWARTGASPFGIGLRGRPAEADLPDYWRYDGLPMPVWVHRDNEEAPQRPFVFAIEPSEELRRSASAGAVVNPGTPLQLHHRGPARARLPSYSGASLHYSAGPHRLELVLDRGEPVAVTPELVLTSGAWPPSVTSMARAC